MKNSSNPGRGAIGNCRAAPGIDSFRVISGRHPEEPRSKGLSNGTMHIT